jgi:outer membrane protein
MRELFVALLLLPGSVSAEPLSLKDAVQRGVDHNVDLAVQQIELALAEDARDRAWSAYEPRLDAGISRSSDLDNYADPDDPVSGVPVRVGVRQAIPGGGSISLSYAGTLYDEKARELGYDSTPDLVVSLTQPLLSGAIFGGRERGVAEAQFAIEESQLALEAGVADLVLGIENAYWSLVQADDSVAAAEQSLGGAQRQQAWVQERIDLGFDAPSELLSTQERIASGEAELTGAVATREDAEADLLYLLGVDLTAAERPTLEPTSVPGGTESTSPEAALEAAAERSIPLRAAKRRLAAARRALRYTVVDQLPSLDGAVSVRRDLGQEDAFTWWTFGLSLSMPLPGIGRIAGIKSGQRRVRQAELRLQDTTQQIQLEVERALRDVKTARARFRLAEQGLDLARRKYDAEVERLSRGTSTNREVLEYLEDRDAAARAWNRSRTAVARSEGRLRRIIGAGLSDWGVQVERLMEAAR